MKETFVSRIPLPEFSPWKKFKTERNLASFDLEITSRCNNNCRHCYINLPADDLSACSKEMTFGDIKKIADQAVPLGALWCLITGGEPLLREDFFDIYLYLRKKGLLVSVFTNCTLITDKHIKFFKEYPPRDIEVTVYGVTKNTYERVTRTAGSFEAFMRGFNLLIKNKIKLRLKTMALRSNVHELTKITTFCRKLTKDYFRFDPFLQLRNDRDEKRNKEIKAERLSAKEVVAIERQDPERFNALKNGCDQLIHPEFSHFNCNHLFHCGIGNSSFSVSCEGFFLPCSSLWHADCIYDLKKGTLLEAWENFTLRIKDMRSDSEDFLKKCRKCQLINLCMWCPARAYLETGELDRPVDFFCELAHAREELLEQKNDS